MVSDDPVVLDASLVGKLLVKEENSNKADRLVEGFIKNDVRMVEPAFLKIEIYSLMRKKVVLGDVGSEQAKKVLSFFNQLGFEYFIETSELLNDSLRLAGELDQTVVYDCVYLALAKSEGAVFYSADQRFIKQAKKVYPNCNLVN